MSRDQHQPPRTPGSPWDAHAPEREPVSPLPRPVEPYLPPGTYGMGVHVPVTAYVPPLPPDITESSPPSALRVVSEDPLAFLAKQAAAHGPVERGPGSQSPSGPGRFRRDAAAPPAGPQRRSSVPPPGFR